MDVKAWVLGTTEVRPAFAKAVEELDAVMLPNDDFAVTLSVESERPSLVTPALAVDSEVDIKDGLDVLALAAPASETPLPEGSVVAALRLEVEAVESTETIDDAFRDAPPLELAADEVVKDSERPALVLASVADSGEIPTFPAVELGGDMMLEEVDVTPVVGPVMPRAGLVTGSNEVRVRPLEAVAAPEAGFIPSVPGLIVGNDEEVPAPVNGAVLLRDAGDSERGGSVGIQPETRVW